MTKAVYTERARKVVGDLVLPDRPNQYLEMPATRVTVCGSESNVSENTKVR